MIDNVLPTCAWQHVDNCISRTRADIWLMLCLLTALQSLAALLYWSPQSGHLIGTEWARDRSRAGAATRAIPRSQPAHSRQQLLCKVDLEASH
jgi:hypothetical protein